MQLEELAQKVCNYYEVSSVDIAKKAHGKTPQLTYGEVIGRLFSGHPNGLAVVFPEVSRTTITALLHKIFPGKANSRMLWSTYLLSVVGYKQCNVCKQQKPLAEFHLANRPDGLRPECKICHNRDTSQWYKDNIDKAAQYSQKYYLDNKLDIQSRQVQYYIDNKESLDTKHKEYRLNNKDKIAESSKLYYENNKAYYKEYRKEYYINNKAKYLAYDAKRRATKLNATPSWANMEEIYRIYISRREGEHVDHIIPLQGTTVCGLHCENNLQYLPAHKNLEKGNSFTPDTHIHQLTYNPPYARQ